MNIITYKDGSARLLWGWRDIELPAANFKALREFFQAERNEALGRWRDPENPDMVVCPIPGNLDAVWVMYEGDGAEYTRQRNQVSYAGNKFSEVAQRYFAAHPEPKPWRAAQPDEVWALTINNDTEEVFRCGEHGLYSLKTGNPIGSLLSCGSNKITASRRIWPEGKASE